MHLFTDSPNPLNAPLPHLKIDEIKKPVEYSVMGETVVQWSSVSCKAAPPSFPQHWGKDKRGDFAQILNLGK
ncbi:hypothetical protein DLK06_14465 [Acinetobacter pittii]|nr:hypothetical protein CDG55_06695 [Acinetobacter sp. WCHA45]AZP30186.1 hypothetical protein DLK06_14465 [Acinetobacter pittii]